MDRVMVPESLETLQAVRQERSEGEVSMVWTVGLFHLSVKVVFVCLDLF